MLSDLQLSGQALQEKIAHLVSGMTVSADSHVAPAAISAIPSETSGVTSLLHGKIYEIESENTKLKTLAGKIQLAVSDNHQVESLSLEKERSAARIIELEAQLKTTERALDERTAKIESLEHALSNSTIDLNKSRNDGESRIQGLQSRLVDQETLVWNLKEAIELKENAENESNSELRAKDAEIASLGARVQKAYSELEGERRDLGAQVDELRQAGQVNTLCSLLSPQRDLIAGG